MIIIQVSHEAVTDLMTPGVLLGTKCTKGLPRGTTLIDVIFNDEFVEYHYDDSSRVISIRTLTYEG